MNRESERLGGNVYKAEGYDYSLGERVTMTACVLHVDDKDLLGVQRKATAGWESWWWGCIQKDAMKHTRRYPSCQMHVQNQDRMTCNWQISNLSDANNIASGPNNGSMKAEGIIYE